MNTSNKKKKSGSAYVLRHLGIRTAAAALVALVAAVCIVAPTAGTASAYSDTQRTGLVNTNVVAPAAIVQPGMTFYVPGVTVPRNGAVPYTTDQRVDVTYYLQYYSNGRWILANQYTQTGWIQNGPSVTLPPIPLKPYYIAGLVGYWRVAYAVQWRGGWAAMDYVTPVTGTYTFVPSLVTDMRCGVPTCKAYAGSLYIW